MVLVGVRHKLNLALHSPLSSSITRLSEQTQIKKLIFRLSMDMVN